MHSLQPNGLAGCQTVSWRQLRVDAMLPSVKRDQMKTQCLLRQNKYHTTAWMNAKTTKLGLIVEIPGLGGRWEIVEIYPYRLTDKHLKTHRALIVS
jgi:hypothetical protein